MSINFSRNSLNNSNRMSFSFGGILISPRSSIVIGPLCFWLWNFLNDFARDLLIVFDLWDTCVSPNEDFDLFIRCKLTLSLSQILPRFTFCRFNSNRSCWLISDCLDDDFSAPDLAGTGRLTFLVSRSSTVRCGYSLDFLLDLRLSLVFWDWLALSYSSSTYSSLSTFIIWSVKLLAIS